MTFRRSLFITSLMMLGGLAFSQNAQAAGTAVTAATVAAIHVESGVPYANFDKPISNPDGCAGTGWVAFPNDLPNQDGYLSLIMTALASGKTVNVYVSTCVNSPWGMTIPRVYAVRVLQ